MAMESACRLTVGKDRYDGKVRMEADHIDFSGPTKFRFRLTEVTEPRQEDDAIVFGFHGHPVTIGLGNARTADSWIDYILHPQTLVDKMGIRQQATVRLLDLEDRALLDSLASKSVKLSTSPTARYDAIILGVERAAELRQLNYLTENLRPGGAIWVVINKTVRTVTKANVIAAAREAGLNHTQIVDYSETQSAHKLVFPIATRRRSGDASLSSAGSR